MLEKIKSFFKPKSPEVKPAWIVTAEKEIGVKEVPGPGDNPRILEYHKATNLKATDDAVPWCSAFVNWVLLHCGYERSHQAAARSFLGVGVILKGYKKYSIVILRRGNSTWQGHVGFAIDETKSHVLVLGGNQGDRVSKAWFRKENVIGYRWPMPEQPIMPKV